MKVGDGFHLSYCTNIHPGESWEAVRAALRTSLPRIREELQCTGAMAIGLRLSNTAAESLEAPQQLAEFRAFLREGDYYVPTINGFPYGAFHGQRVKEQVYLPDWRSRERLDYSNRLARLLVTLLDSSHGVEGSVRTVPGAFRSSVRGDADVRAIALNILRHAAFLADVRARTGTTVTLALEPEPACLIETTTDAVSFFTRFLFDPDLISAAAREAECSFGLDDVRRHLGLCLDACHLAVQFEDPVEALAQLRHAGIRLCKVQVSSALRLENRDGVSLSNTLARFADDTYLHQVVEKAHGPTTTFVDLPQALDEAARDPGVQRTWRVHFHVPIFLSSIGGLDTTQPDLRALLAALKRDPVCRLLEIETYTWDVLPPEDRTTDVCTAIAREMSWTRSQLDT